MYVGKQKIAITTNNNNLKILNKQFDKLIKTY